ncbi:MAG: prolyl oligopeptidase family serine peptidase [Aestuariibacter sp.]|nr:prolyl oligopeptidase family serine peptidase [Aestuariibacter sp.]MCP4276052.1 prolyl oligopeptidase family serine peptidase [Gammaproteobacteria bacterium]MCP4947685.1 prolyl oligopeptidase family serine peptidase [Aestuariibacter sp.]
MDLPAEIASEGYIVLGSQYRGASRRLENNGKDEFGGADVNDVLALIDIAKSLPHADTSRIALVGWSRGVMQSYLAAKQLTDVKAIVSVAGNADLKQAIAWRPEMEKVYAARMPDYASQKEQLLSERSVINWVDQLPPAPILMLHGTADTRVNVEQSRLLASALNVANHTNKLVTYEGDNHGLTHHRTAAYAEIKDWLQQYLVAR